MHFIKIHLTSNRVVFSTMNVNEITTYLFSFLTDEEKVSTNTDLAFCIENAWLHPVDDFAFYSSLGIQPYSVDPATNELTVTFIAHQIEHLCENLFDPPKVGVNPVKNYFDANPSEGSYDLTVLDSNGNDVTSMYSKL
jgi:hypothetical protein